MGSPFPGMDPYLEGEMWMEFHDRLANEISAQLMPRLGTKYVALLNKQYVRARDGLEIVVEDQEKTFYPDVHILETKQAKEPAVEYAAPNAPVSFIELPNPMPEDIPLLHVEIRDLRWRRLVTVIEILSPWNKRGRGWRDYDDKRQALLLTETHLVELDLLRAGKRIRLLGDLPPASYYVYLSHAEERPKTKVWFIPLREKLPTLPIPLLSPDPDVALDIQAAIDACFNLVHYERLLDYTQPLPPPALSTDDARWVAEKIRAAGYVE